MADFPPPFMATSADVAPSMNATPSGPVPHSGSVGPVIRSVWPVRLTAVSLLQPAVRIRSIRRHSPPAGTVAWTYSLDPLCSASAMTRPASGTGLPSRVVEQAKEKVTVVPWVVLDRPMMSWLLVPVPPTL